MSGCHGRWYLLILVAILAGEVPAQVVRGRVTETTSTAPVVGALVSLLPESVDSALFGVLTTPAGEYTIRAPAAGRYRLAVKRIGVKRFISTPFGVGEGETHIIHVPIEAVAQTLPAVAVSGLCATPSRDRPWIASLWDEVRTALDATGISQRDALIQARVSRYAAELDPRSLQVLYDWQHDAETLVGQPFTSASGDSLSALGYWREAGDSVEYTAPDARALTSNAFVRNHCFSVSAARRDRPELVGLDFRSVARRTVPDIAGTIWIDARLFELRFIEFRYTRLPPDTPDVANAGGEVHFARLATGAWIVERWFIRAPQVIWQRLQADSPVPWREAPNRRVLLEGGGAVIAEGRSMLQPPAAVTGVLRDSAGGPLTGAIVRAIGINRQSVTSADGAYRLDSLPTGDFAIIAHAAGYDSIAVLVGTRRVQLRAGELAQVDFKAPDTVELRSMLCPVPNANRFQQPAGDGVMRLVMVDSASAAPIRGVVFVVAWPPTFQARKGRPDRDRHQAAVTDNRGAVSFCHLPTGIPLELTQFGPDNVGSPVVTFQTSRASLSRLVLEGAAVPTGRGDVPP